MNRLKHFTSIFALSLFVLSLQSATLIHSRLINVSKRNSSQKVVMDSLLVKTETPEIDFSSMLDHLYASVDVKAIFANHDLMFKQHKRRQSFEFPGFEGEGKLPEIEDFSVENDEIEKFEKSLENIQNSISRVGFIGDSFIEGDILSCDVREMMQEMFGGNGVGFVPTTSVAASFRGTIKHKYSGWESFNIKKKSSEAIDEKFIICSFYSKAQNVNAQMEYEITHSRNNLDKVTSLRYFFISERASKIELLINDSISRSLTTEASTLMQSVELSLDSCYIERVKITIPSQKDFYSYGVSFEGGSGIYVDNFSDRGSSGMQLTKLSKEQCMMFDTLSGGYSLIVVQYGLNVMYAGQQNYTAYENRMVKIVDDLREYYPNATLLVMGVSDRMIKQNGVYQPMSEIEAMERHQRQIAERCGVLFWSTYDAMQNYGGIKGFVERGWAAKDYTHINNKGARVIAEQLVASLYEKLKEKSKK
ncbi:MAG: hypothetical protein R3Y04_00045 [Rikenellaceae bacterium]